MDWIADDPGRVLYVDAELNAENIMAWWQRLGPACENLDLISDKLNFRYGLPRVTFQRRRVASTSRSELRKSIRNYSS